MSQKLLRCDSGMLTCQLPAVNVGLFGISTLTAWMTVKEIGTSIDYTFASDVKDSSETQLGLEGESEKVKA